MTDEQISKKDNLKQAGLKITTPRLRVLEIFETSTERHLSADEVYKIIVDTEQNIGIATVYRVLTQFEKSGILHKHNFDSGHSVFELEKGEHHDHLLCIKCGKVIEFVDQKIENRQLEIANDNNFEITDHSLIIYGICASCKKN